MIHFETEAASTEDSAVAAIIVFEQGADVEESSVVPAIVYIG